MKTKFHYGFILALPLALLSPKTNAQTIKSGAPSNLIQFWDFNQTLPIGGAGGDSLGNVTNALNANQYATGLTPGHIIYSRPHAVQAGATLKDSILDNGAAKTAATTATIYDYSNSNDTNATALDNTFVRTRNPSENATFTTFIPTVGYKNISLEFALSASSASGATYLIFSYTTDGTTWKNLTTAMDTFNISGVYRPDTLLATNSTTVKSEWYPVSINFSTDASVNNNANFAVRFTPAGSTSTGTSGNDRYDNFAVLGTAVTTGANEIAQQAGGYNIYPSPATDFVNVVSSNYTGAKVITVYNIAGQKMSTTENQDLQTTINVSSLSSGLYFVQIKEVSTGNTYTVKVVKN